MREVPLYIHQDGAFVPRRYTDIRHSRNGGGVRIPGRVPGACMLHAFDQTWELPSTSEFPTELPTRRWWLCVICRRMGGADDDGCRCQAEREQLTRF